MEILLRADSHYACPEVLDWCEANGLDYILGLAPTSTLKRHVGGLEASTSARFKAVRPPLRRFKEFHDAAGSWSRVRRIVARVEAGGDGTDTRFIVTNLGHGNGRSLYQDLYCRRVATYTRPYRVKRISSQSSASFGSSHRRSEDA